jgi:hypothetical protein
VLALVGWAFPASALESEGDERAVRETFEAYKQALLQRQGARASALVDRATWDYWGELRRLALSGSEEELRQRPFIERLLVVSLRHELSVEELRQMDLEAMLGRAIEAGWIAPASIAQLEMGEVRLEGDRASGQALTRTFGDPPSLQPVEGLRYEFVREEDEWHFAFASLVAGLDRLLGDFAAQLGADEDDLIFSLVESFSGRTVLPEVWQPPTEGDPPQSPGGDDGPPEAEGPGRESRP